MPRGRKFGFKTRTHCRDCKVELNATNIRWIGTGVGPTCKECTTAANKKYYWEQGGKEKLREYNAINTYGMTSEEYNKMVEMHQGGCAICRQPCKTGKKLGIDHNHKTGKVRGLLCLTCNQAMGLLKEDEDIIWNMLEYLKRTTWEKAEVA